MVRIHSALRLTSLSWLTVYFWEKQKKKYLPVCLSLYILGKLWDWLRGKMTGSWPSGIRKCRRAFSKGTTQDHRDCGIAGIKSSMWLLSQEVWHVHSSRKGRCKQDLVNPLDISVFHFRSKRSHWMVHTEWLAQLLPDTRRSPEPGNGRTAPLIKHLICLSTFSFASKRILFSESKFRKHRGK